MRISIVSLVSLFLLCITSTLAADTPELKGGVYIHDGTNPIDLVGHTAPVVTDWNEDGAKDLVVGNIKGNIWLFLNQGTDLNPLFNGGTMIESNGTAIYTVYS